MNLDRIISIVLGVFLILFLAVLILVLLGRLRWTDAAAANWRQPIPPTTTTTAPEG